MYPCLSPARHAQIALAVELGGPAKYFCTFSVAMSTHHIYHSRVSGEAFFVESANQLPGRAATAMDAVLFFRVLFHGLHDAGVPGSPELATKF